jgi:hypothetical protein
MNGKKTWKETQNEDPTLQELLSAVKSGTVSEEEAIKALSHGKAEELSLPYITLAGPTKKHPERLASWGYKTETKGNRLFIEAEVVEGEVKFEDFPKLVAEKKLISYATRVICPDGKKRFSMPLIFWMNSNGYGDFTAIVAKVEKQEPKKEKPVLPAAFANLLTKK